MYYYERGEEALQRHEFATALAFFHDCLQKDPYYYDAYYSQGLVKEQLQDLKGALTDYNIYLEKKPQHTEALFSRGVLRYKLEMYDLARQDFEKLLQLPPGETTTIFFQVDAFGQGANKVFITQGSGKAYLYNYLGLCQTRLGQLQNAVTAFDKAIELNPNDPDLFVNRGLAKEGMNDLTSAVTDYQAALARNPDHGLARHNLGVLAARQGLDATSEKFLTEAIEKSPGLPYPHAQRGFARFERKDYAGALQDYNEAVRLDSSDVDYVINRGVVKEKLRDLNGALADFSKAATMAPNAANAWFHRGNVLSKLNRLPEAIEDYTLAIFYDASYAAAYYNRALAQNRTGQKKEACNDLMKAKDLGMKVEPKVETRICSR